MIACVDVDYRDSEAVAACVLFSDWSDAASAAEFVERFTEVEAYQPGQFFRRELPCLLRVLADVTVPLETVVIDGYVGLGDNRPGLGAHLYEALDRSVPIIGVAKTHFHGAVAEEVCRGASRRPLFISAAGLDVQSAADHIRSMHGPYRIPTLLAQVDQLCRGHG